MGEPKKEKSTISTKKKWVKPVIKKVWNENIGMSGVYLLEM